MLLVQHISVAITNLMTQGMSDCIMIEPCMFPKHDDENYLEKLEPVSVSYRVRIDKNIIKCKWNSSMF